MKKYENRYKVEIAVSSVFLIMLTLFFITSPRVFLDYRIYMAIFTNLGVLIILSVSNVFIVTAGEIDVSFPSMIGLGGWIFASLSSLGLNLFLALLLALIVCSIAGLINGILVVKLGLSSLITTLGMLFLLRGVINIFLKGNFIILTFLKDTFFRNIFVGRIGVFPVSMLWGIFVAVLAWIFYYRHKFGGYISFIGDNITAAKEMGINVEGVKIITFIIPAVAAGFSGFLLTMTNNFFTGTSGDGYLLIVLVAVFIGGTPTWGGVGTIFGAVVGAFIMGFIESGIVAAGLTGFYTQFFFGLILIIALIGHKFNGLEKK